MNDKNKLKMEALEAEIHVLRLLGKVKAEWGVQAIWAWQADIHKHYKKLGVDVNYPDADRLASNRGDLWGGGGYTKPNAELDED